MLKLKMEPIPHSDDPRESIVTVADLIAQGRKRKRAQSSSNRYIDGSFILGSEAEVERFWFVCGNILTPGRRSLSPVMFESIIFLKVNPSYWGPSTVLKAMNMAQC